MMKHLFFLYFRTIWLAIFLSCEKENVPVSVVLPDSVEINQSVVFLNGEPASSYKASFVLDTLYDKIDFPFFEVKNNGLDANILSFSWLPIRSGDYKLITQRILRENALTGFDMIVGEDLNGYSYKLIEQENGFFNLEHLDTTNRIVRGRFQAKFQRTAKNNNDDLGLPKILLFQGVFHEYYRRKSY